MVLKVLGTLYLVLRTILLLDTYYLILPLASCLLLLKHLDTYYLILPLTTCLSAGGLCVSASLRDLFFFSLASSLSAAADRLLLNIECPMLIEE
jgi:hypothetical protein